MTYIDNYFISVIGAIALGWVEQFLLGQGALTGKKWILGHFATYHIILLVVFIALAYPFWQLVPLLILIEDISFFTFRVKDDLGPDNWVNWIFGGFYIGSRWVPFTYIILLALFIVLEFFL